MRQKKFLEYPLIIFLIILGIMMAVVKWQYKDVVWEDVRPTITIIPSPTIAPQINEEYPLWEKLPYKGKSYVVERYIEPGTLMVTIDKKADEEIISQMIYEWIKESQVATESQKLIFEKSD